MKSSILWEASVALRISSLALLPLEVILGYTFMNSFWAANDVIEKECNCDAILEVSYDSIAPAATNPLKGEQDLSWTKEQMLL